MGRSSLLRFIHRLGVTGDSCTLSDAQLLERFAEQQDEAAFHALVRRHGTMVWSVCRRVLVREQDAEDAFQATFVVLAKKAAAIRKPELLGAWLFGVARRAALKARDRCRLPVNAAAEVATQADPLAVMSVELPTPKPTPAPPLIAETPPPPPPVPIEKDETVLLVGVLRKVDAKAGTLLIASGGDGIEGASQTFKMADPLDIQTPDGPGQLADLTRSKSPPVQLRLSADRREVLGITILPRKKAPPEKGKG